VLSLPGPGSDPLSSALGPIELLRFGMAIGQTVVLFDRSVSADVNSDGRVDSIQVVAESSFIGVETITTAAGRFVDASHVRTVISSSLRLGGESALRQLTVTNDEWLAPGVGPVRSVSQATGTGQTAEDTVEELQAYGVGNRRSDSSPPTVRSSSPSANSVAAPGTSITLNFSKPVDPLSLAGSSGLQLTHAAGQVISATLTGSSDGLSVTVTPRSTLSDGSYELRNAGGVSDWSNNPLPVSLCAFRVDTVGPRIVTSSPANGFSEASTTADIVLTFDEPLVALSGQTVMLQLYAVQASETSVIPAVIRGNSLVATLKTPLLRNAEYMIGNPSNLQDAAGNPAPASNNSIRFRTDPGSLSRPQVLMANASVEAVLSADIDGDGRADLLFAAQGVGTSNYFIGVRRQRSDGSFAEAVRLHTLAPYRYCGVSAIAVTDANGDGRPDIVLAGSCSPLNPLTVLMQQSDGSFSAENLPTNLGSNRIFGVDLNGGGQGQLGVALLGNFAFLRRDAANQWSTTVTIPIGSDFAHDWRLADLNGDGKPDLVWLRITNDRRFELVWAPRVSSGFGASRVIASLPFEGQTIHLAVGDLDGDDRADIALSSTLNSVSKVLVFSQDSNGEFKPPVAYPAYYQAATLTLGDVNGDGRADVVLTHSAASKLGIFLQASNGSLEAERLFEASYDSYNSGQALTLLDLNSDGRVDIVANGDVFFGRPLTGTWPLSATRGQVLRGAGTTFLRRYQGFQVF
jgi:Bacterial Ig-like domain/FG-GAP-like repeat